MTLYRFTILHANGAIDFKELWCSSRWQAIGYAIDVEEASGAVVTVRCNSTRIR